MLNAGQSMKKLTGLLSQHRKRKNTTPLPKSSLGTISLFNAISSLPNELLLPILRNIYPPEAFRRYNPHTNRGTVAFWDAILEADQLMVSISRISKQFRKITVVILEELVKASNAIGPEINTWKTISGVHREYREDSKWQWGYGVVYGRRGLSEGCSPQDGDQSIGVRTAT